MKWNNLNFSKFNISKFANFNLYLFHVWYYHRWKSVNDVIKSYRASSRDMLIYRAKILWEEAYDATLKRPNASFVASFDNILALLIITF
jgi:hypothetical protein